MWRLVRQSLALLMSLVSLGAMGREVVPVVDYTNIPVSTASGKPLTAEQVRDVIVSAGQSNKWEIARRPGQDLLTATLEVRGKHTVVVTIPYSAAKFSIRYESSTNMKYSVRDKSMVVSSNPMIANGRGVPTAADGIPVIHPAYNLWVHDLLQAIQGELKKL